jgi:hypothetical protein
MRQFYNNSCPSQKCIIPAKKSHQPSKLPWLSTYYFSHTTFWF